MNKKGEKQRACEVCWLCGKLAWKALSALWFQCHHCRAEWPERG